MGILGKLKPETVMKYFEEICAIPHSSGDTKRISDYCVRFAQERGLKYIQDAHNNVVIYKPATVGYEDHPTVIVQGHMDMVCEKDADCDLDFSEDGLRLRYDGTYISADGTTLGADDGIAVAYQMAILAATDLKHPPIEAVFTVDEEIGMLGADAMDMSVLKGRILLNCDSEDEGILTVGCAGGVCSTLTKTVQREAVNGQVWRMAVADLIGGHSGVEINSGRANANKVLAEILKDLPVRLICVDGGRKDNAITRASEALVVADAPEKAFFARAEEVRKTLPESETQVRFICEPAQSELLPMSEKDSRAVIGLLSEVPQGVQKMSPDIENLVQTSLNLGILKTENDAVAMTFSVRSSVNEEKKALMHTLAALGEKYGAEYSESGDYPAWEYQKQSYLRDTMAQVFREQYGKEMKIEVIHAGLECGIFYDRLPGLDAVSFGPQIHDIHTSRERLDAASTERTWKLLTEVLARL